jgi:glycosyltransferase involved in cell wall biosynthesis
MDVMRWVYDVDPGLPLVSVITPCYEYCDRFLPETVSSVARQSYGHIEHLVLHSGCGTGLPVYLPEARNRLVREASGEYILPLDADDLFVPTAVAKMMGCRGWADIISCQQQEFGESHIRYGSPSYTHLDFRGFLAANRIHCASLFPKALWEEVGGYDEELFEAYEDWDFWLRCARAGKTFYVIPQALFLYRRHADSLTTRVGANHALAKFRRKWPV